MAQIEERTDKTVITANLSPSGNLSIASSRDDRLEHVYRTDSTIMLSKDGALKLAGYILAKFGMNAGPNMYMEQPRRSGKTAACKTLEKTREEINEARNRHPPTIEDETCVRHPPTFEGWWSIHYPVPAHRCPKGQEARHSLRKWSGYLPLVLKAYGLISKACRIYRGRDMVHPVNIGTSALCQANGINCRMCLLTEVRDGYSCICRRPDENISPYEHFQYTGDPTPMIHWLQIAAAVEIEREEKGEKDGLETPPCPEPDGGV